MRSGKGRAAAGAAAALILTLAGPSPRAASPAVSHQQRYSMGTMFDIVAYHEPVADAQRAMAAALDEVVRLDKVLSHYRTDSDLAALERNGNRGFVQVHPDLFAVLRESAEFSRLSAGTFDVTIGPLLKIWREARADGRRPSGAQLGEARRCVGYQRIELEPPDRVQLLSSCLSLDLGGIGKGYAVDRAMAVLASAGIRHALVNAGGSSIAASGHPPGQRGWPVRLGAASNGRTLLLSDGSISTSQQGGLALPLDAATPGEILDPGTGEPARAGVSVSVVAPRATVSDALSTTLLLLPDGRGPDLLARFPGTSALWISDAGEIRTTYQAARLVLADGR
jgi:thiamine biosynthesis lipoprotein